MAPRPLCASDGETSAVTIHTAIGIKWRSWRCIEASSDSSDAPGEISPQYVPLPVKVKEIRVIRLRGQASTRSHEVGGENFYRAMISQERLAKDCKPLQRVDAFGAIDVRPADGPAQDLDRAIVRGAIHGIGNPVLASVRKGKPRRIARAGVRAVDEL